MYGMWWNKPLTPMEPIILRGEWVEPILAFIYTSSEMSGYVDQKQLRSQTMVKTIFAFLHLYSKTPEIETFCCRQPRALLSIPLTSSSESLAEETTRTAYNVLLKHQRDMAETPDIDIPTALHPLHENCSALIGEKIARTDGATAFFEPRPRVSAATEHPSFCDPATARRWRLAASTLNAFPEVASNLVSFSHLLDASNPHESNVCVHYRSQQLVAHRSRNWPGDDLLRDVGGLVVGIILWFANFLYGGLHAAAWNEHFPSTGETWLWRASASYIGFCGGLWVLVNYLVSSQPGLNDFWEKWMSGEKSWWHNILLGSLVFICGLSLVIARVYLVVEAFLNIRELPMKAYETPSWTQSFPHL